ncbi:hypothetical protein LJR030_005248 [Rhizobium sp. LjRoot30]|uniref:hypothetical protein n=1 Tax=Rhizobium sp. LjRoot30 TaxID=3342320 RepID=UPI003ED0EE61
MADFAAVIRRAVDGLSDNTPEMRVKVYEKARGAVQRQLESMKPRPPEEMLRRQLDKLELAIRDVENEHAEALPAVDEDPAVEAAEDWQQPEQEAVEDERQSYDEPVTAEPAAETAWQDEGSAPVAEEEPQPQEVVAAEPVTASAEDEREPWDPPEVAHADNEPATPVHAEPEPWETPVETHAAPEPEPWETPAEPEDHQAPPAETVEEPAQQPASGVEELILDSAVIRQAIDAQPVNSADIRARIYDNARASVRQYLGNLMPRPSDESIARQFDKLDQVIEEVEQGYLAAAQPAVADTSEPWDMPADHSDVPSDERSSQGLVPDERHIGMWQETPPDEQPQASTENATTAASWQSPEPERTEQDSPFAEPWEDEPEPLPAVQATAAQNEWADTLPSAPERNDEHLSAGHDDFDQARSFDGPVAVEHETPAQVPASVENVSHADAAGAADDWAFPEAETSGQATTHAAGAGSAAGYAAGTPSDDRLSEPKMPPALDLLDWDETSFGEEGKPDAQAGATQRAADNKAIDPFDDGDAFSGEVGPMTPAVATSANKSQDSWNDLDELIGDNKHSGRGGDRQPAAGVSNGVASQRPGKSFRVEPKRRFNFTVLALGLLLAVALGGGGYAAWLYQDRLKDMVANLVDSGPQIPGLETKPEEKATTETTPSDAKPETAANTPAAEQTTGNDTKPATTPTTTDTSKDLAALDTNNLPAANKFTQRLLVNGSEVDDGPGGEAASTEGKSVAEQNVAANEAGNTTTTDTSGAATTGNPTTTTDTQTTVPTQTGQVDGTTQTPAAENTTTTDGTQQTAAAVAGGQKMFLYEERIGQSVPTAIQGTVVWSLQQETGENGKPEPTVQGQINVPDRGLSALMTFKRNSDPSLPASHLVEIVFSLPQDFEGGAIDSVQRIAMKQTEQDRGNALIAVPAKITDDFHMIALNDFPEARASNLELLRTRGWIDMPITYRNGRRALLTLEKGEPGNDAFNKAVQAWLALANTPASGQ